MKFVCDAPEGNTWFRLETEIEAEQESVLMQHAVEKHFRREKQKAAASYKPTSTIYIEQNIGLGAHLQRAMPIFLTLRDGEGNGLATAMLPPDGSAEDGFATIVVGQGNGDPYSDHDGSIQALGKHFGLPLEREHCFPYRR